MVKKTKYISPVKRGEQLKIIDIFTKTGTKEDFENIKV